MKNTLLIAAAVALPLLCAAAPAAATTHPAMKSGVTKINWGVADGQPVELYTLTGHGGIIAKVTSYGAMLTELHAPDRHGKMADVVLGFDTLEGYLKGHPVFGCTTGRYANRIAKGQFTLDGQTYKLATNNGPNHLHGGLKGFDKKVWKATIQVSALGPSVRFEYTSPDGEEGYPGNLKMSVAYTLAAGGELWISYQATTDKPTIINLTNHSYFNLAGAGSGDILKHELRINADHFTPTDPTDIPLGEIKPVAGTVWDFTKPQTVGARFAALKALLPPNAPGGYDHNYVLNRPTTGHELSDKLTRAFCAELYEPSSGRVMTIHTTEPGVQLYTGNYLDGKTVGKGGKAYPKHGALCLETQHFPDSPNQPKFPTTVLRPREVYSQTTVHRFSVRK